MSGGRAAVAFILSPRGRLALIAGSLALAWLLFATVPGGEDTGGGAPAQEATAGEGGASRTIRATLYYVAEDGIGLQGVEREVPFADGVTAQARLIAEAQLAAAPAPLESAIPPGTTLRALYVSDRGEAFVDLGYEVVANHPGGSLEELFTVYAIVNAIATNLSSISAVQLLVGGSEVDTLAGHVDLRHPLRANLDWVQRPEAPQTAARATP